MCLNMDACSRGTRKLSRDRSDLQARGTLLKVTRRLSALMVLQYHFTSKVGLHIAPETLGDCESRCTYSHSDRVGVSLHLNGIKRRYHSHCVRASSSHQPLISPQIEHVLPSRDKGLPPGRRTTPVSLVVFRAAAVDEQQHQGLTAFACVYVRARHPACPYAVEVADENTRMQQALRPVPLLTLRKPGVDIDLTLIFGAAPVATRQFLAPRAVLVLCGGTMASDSRRCRMPSGE